MAKKYLHYTNEQQEAINRLHKLLEARGINTKDPKHPDAFSDSALFRYLIEQELKRQTNK